MKHVPKPVLAVLTAVMPVESIVRLMLHAARWPGHRLHRLSQVAGLAAVAAVVACLAAGSASAAPARPAWPGTAGSAGTAAVRTASTGLGTRFIEQSPHLRLEGCHLPGP